MSKLKEAGGLSHKKIYRLYKHMIGRTTNKNDENYKYYGGRGIKVCNEWKNDFLVFYKWAMENGYKEGLTIDRIDVNGNYEPLNCRFSDWKTQANNRTNNRYLEYNNRKKTITQWADELNIKRSTLNNMINKGISINEIVDGSYIRYKKIKFNNKYYSVIELAKKMGVSKQFMYQKIKKNSIEGLIRYCNGKKYYRDTTKRINQYDLQGRFIKTWECASEIGNKYGINPDLIRKNCSGKAKTAKGYIWKYEE